MILPNSLLRAALALLLFSLASGVGYGQQLQSEELQRLDPLFQQLLNADLTGAEATQALPQLEPLPGSSADKNGRVRYGASIYTQDVAALRRSGIAYNSVFPRFVTARLTVGQLATLARMPSVEFVNAAETFYPTNDVTVGWTGAALLQSGFVDNTNYRGQGTLVCVIDSGADWTHEDFRDPASPDQSRILYLWDQTLTATGSEQTPAQRAGGDFSTFNIGVEYTRADIEDEIDGSPSGFIRSRDTDGHGTHVAGTAVGSGGAHPEGKYAGMAPEADLIVVKAGNSRFSFNNVADGMNYCGEVAEDEGRPVVVNMSLGTPSGPHDGTTDIEQAIDAFTGAGRVVVTSAGNDGNSNMHVREIIAAGDSTSLLMDVSSYTATAGADNDVLVADAWLDNGDAATVRVITPGGTVVTRLPGASGNTTTPDGTVFLSNTVDVANGDRHVQVMFFDSDASTPPSAGAWEVRFVDDAGTGNGVHAWLVDSTIGTDTGGELVVRDGVLTNAAKTVGSAQFRGADSQYTVGAPGTSATAITVGAHVHRWRFQNDDGASLLYSSTSDRTGDLATFSSIGPRRDGLQKPDITAPGQATGSALSSDHNVNSALKLPGGKHYVTQGTSMSSPAVAGAVALLLQDDPSLSASRVKELLTNTAVRDGNTGGVPNASWGFGKLDIFRAMGALTGNPAAERELLAYDDPAPASQFSSVTVGGSGVEKLAVRISPSTNGDVTGISLHLGSGTANRLTGPLNVEIWADDGSGLPGAKLGTTVQVQPDALLSFSPNFIPMTAAGVSVSSGTDYHAVIFPETPTDELDVASEVASVDQRSSALMGGSSLRISHARVSKSGGEWASPKSAKNGTWGQLSSDLMLRTYVASVSPSNLAVDISSLDFRLIDPGLPSDVRFVASVSVENNGLPVRGLSPSNFTLTEEGTGLPISLSGASGCTFTPPSAGGTRLADIVFVIDNSGSMGFEQDDVIDNIITFVTELENRGVDFALGLTRYGQSSRGTPGLTSGGPIFEDGGSLTQSVERFKNEILTRNITSGGLEPGYYAIASSIQNFSFRPGAKKIIIIATDETPAQATSLGDLEDARQALVSADATLYASTVSSLNGAFQPLTDDTNGQIFDIFDDFSTTVADAITGQVSSTYIFSCLSPISFLGTETPPTNRLVDIGATVSGEADSDTSSYDPGGRALLQETASVQDALRRPQADNTELNVEVDVRTFTGPAVQSVNLFYRAAQSNAPFSSVAMTPTGTQPTSSKAKTATQTTYAGAIPAAEMQPPGVEFYIRVSDGQSSVTLPSTDAVANPLTVAVLPNEPPSLAHDPIISTVTGQDLTVTADAEDQTNQVSSVTLFYRMQGNLSYTTLPMTNTSGAMYEAVIPGADITDAGLEYYIEAADDFNVTVSAGTADQPLVELKPPTLASPSNQTFGLPTSFDVTFSRVSRAVRYEVHLATGPDFPESETDTTVVTDTTATFSDLAAGQDYYWRVRPVRSALYPGVFSDTRTFTTYPNAVQTSVSRSFGDPTQSTSYRLVALPGDRSTGIDDVLGGTGGEDWEAYWDTGAEEGFFVAFDGSETFAFGPGNGFWVLSSSDVSVNESVPTVTLQPDFTAEIGLHSGWNIISNPLDRDVSWSAVEAANGGSLQAIWEWEGQFAEVSTFGSAGSGEAYYFLNDQNLQTLKIPYPNAPTLIPTSASTKEKSAELMLVSLQAETVTSSIGVALDPNASEGIDELDQFAPPGRFAVTSLHLKAQGTDSLSSRQQLLAREYRSSETEGHVFDLILTSPKHAPVDLAVRNLDAVGDRSIALLNPATGRSYDLTRTTSVSMTPTRSETPLQLIIGDAAFVEQQTTAALPEEVTLLPNYPNPVVDRTTIRFGLPEAGPVRLTVYDLLGRRVAVLADGRYQAGTHEIQWGGTAQGRRPLASGLYLIRLDAGEQTRSIKATVVR